MKGSPPHTRGHYSARGKDNGVSRITPAYAGTLFHPMALQPVGRDHPRIRGDIFMSAPTGRGIKGSPPHTRGHSEDRRSQNRQRRITPAYAGTLACQKVPPTRGHGSPPHTRGHSWALICLICPSRITPAYAGTFYGDFAFQQGFWDHPRIRGDITPVDIVLLSNRGSPPHTRGHYIRP